MRSRASKVEKISWLFQTGPTFLCGNRSIAISTCPELYLRILARRQRMRKRATKVGKVRVHVNVVPRSTGNTNSGTELTLKCKL